MDVRSFMSGNFLTHLDLPAPSQIWIVRDVQQQLVGTDQKICLHFAEHPKPLGMNKTNLRVIADQFGLQSEQWIGQRLEVFKARTDYQGKPVDCIRLAIPPQAQSQPIVQQTQVPPQPVAQQTQVPPQPVAPPAQMPPQPVAPPVQTQGGAADAPWPAGTQPG